MYTEDELIMLSGIQHIAFCERQFALAYVESMWEENLLTIQGHHLHERVDDPFESDYKGNTVYLRSVYLVSYNLGIYGKADLVELTSTSLTTDSVQLKDLSGRWLVKPVEYKRGKPKPDVCDEVQLCAQAMCLEEMYNINISSAEIFYGEPRRRHKVELGDNLRQLTRQYAIRMHELFRQKYTPKPVYKKHCHSCSLYDLCNPKALSGQRSAELYMQQMLSFDL